jgi:MFS family permease
VSSSVQPITASLGEELKTKWPVMLVAYLMMLFAFGFPTFALPFVYAGAIDEFGWTRQEAVLLASFKFYTSAIASLVVGRLLDTIDPKYLVSACAALGGIGMVGFLGTDALPSYYMVGVILGLNAAGMAVSMNYLVARTFERSTGTALGIVLAGTSTAGAIVPLIMAPLMGSIGWRNTMAAMSLGIWLVAIPAWLILLRKGDPLADSLRSPASRPLPSAMWAHFKELSVTRNFWFIFIGIFLVSAVDQGLLQNQVLFLRNEKGLDLDTVAWGASLLALIGIGSKIMFGWVFDRISITGIVLCYALLAVSVGLSFAVTGVATMMLFMTVRGFAHGGLIVDAPILAKHHYGPQNVGLNIGLFTLCISVGYGFGPPFLAGMADDSGSYLGGFGIALGAAALATLLLYPIKPRFWTPPAKRS